MSALAGTASAPKLVGALSVVIFLGVVAVHRVDGIPGHAGDCLAGREQTRKLDLNRIDAGDVMHHHSNPAAILGKGRLPFGLGECACK
jgi:hypothetical protein